MKKHLNILVAMIMAAALAVSLSSCSDDDNYYGSTGYYMCTRAWGGGLSSSEIDELIEMNNDALDQSVNYILKNYDRNQAISYFEAFVVEFRNELRNGIDGIDGTLTLVLELRTLSGTKIRSQMFHITSSGCKLV